jgi:hypothetical protein
MAPSPPNGTFTDRTRAQTDAGALRDKVAAPDPTAVPLATDSEASGSATPGSVANAAAAAQAALAGKAVPRRDPSRAISAAARPETERVRHPIVIALAISGTAAAAIVAALIAATLT